MDIDGLVMLSILQLHRGESLMDVDGKLCDVAGINDIRIANLHNYLLSTNPIVIDINNLNASINRLVSKGFLAIDNGCLCPSFSMVHHYVEILQYGDDKEENINILSKSMSNMEN